MTSAPHEPPWGLIDIGSVAADAGSGSRGVAAIASAQHGIVTARQLGYLGFSRSTISRGASKGRLHRVHQGVYLVGHLAGGDLARLAAAVLALGEGSTLSHRSAAHLLELLVTELELIHVTVIGSGRRRRSGIDVHRSTDLDPRDLTRRQFIPVTAPARTILDIAEHDGVGLAEQALNQARLRRVVTRSHFVDLHRRTSGRAGWRALRPLLREDGTDDFSRSKAERAMNRLIRRAHLPKPRRNRRVHGIELDFYWPDLKLNIEIDGYQWHSARSSNNSDRDRDTLLASRGIQVIRFSRDQLRFEPEVVVARLAAALALAAAA